MRQKSIQNNGLEVKKTTLDKNIRRLFGTHRDAAKRLNYSYQTIRDMVYNGRVSDAMLGRLWRIGIDPAEIKRR